MVMRRILVTDVTAPREGCPLETEYGTGRITYCGGKVHTGEDWCRQHLLEWGKSMRPYPVAIALLIDGWDGDDPYGSAMAVAFGMADVASALPQHEVHNALEYTPGLGESWTMEDILDDNGDSVSYEARVLAEALQSGAVTPEDLMFGARVISRYLDICKMYKRDY